MKPDQIFLTESSKENLGILNALLPGVEDVFLLETALQLTAGLYKKSSEGAVILIQSEKGKTEELRFKLKKAGKKKTGNQA
jgi:hypothetical protein